MINFPQGFKIISDEPIDSRLLLTKAEMRAAKKATLPSKYFAICKDDGEIYLYDSENEIDETTGRYRLAFLDIRNDLDEAIEDIATINSRLDTEFVTAETLPEAITTAMAEQPETMEAAVATAIPGALSEALRTQADQNSGLEVDTDGNIKVKLNEEQLKIEDNQISLAFSVIQATDN